MKKLSLIILAMLIVGISANASHSAQYCRNNYGVSSSDEAFLIQPNKNGLGNAYNTAACNVIICKGERPGRRNISLTCGETIQFSACTDCPEDPCYEWFIDTPSTIGSSIDPDTGLYTAGTDCAYLDYPVVETIVVTDPCNGYISDSVTVTVGQVVLDVGNTNAHPNTDTAEIEVSLINHDHHVKAIQVDIEECSGQDDYMTCTGCLPDEDRAPQFMCIANEMADGSCRVLLLTTNPAALIGEGEGVVFTVLYEVEENAPGEDCTCLWPARREVADSFNEPLCSYGHSGDVCFFIRGDVYPQDCPDCTTCGDGVVDLFDILEEIDIILGLQTPTTCQLIRGDVPNGIPPYCGNPTGFPNCLNDGYTDIFDAMVIIDMALGKMNCCDYCMFGKIY